MFNGLVEAPVARGITKLFRLVRAVVPAAFCFFFLAADAGVRLRAVLAVTGAVAARAALTSATFSGLASLAGGGVGVTGAGIGAGVCISITFGRKHIRFFL